MHIPSNASTACLSHLSLLSATDHKNIIFTTLAFSRDQGQFPDPLIGQLVQKFRIPKGGETQLTVLSFVPRHIQIICDHD